jgi:ATP phosphoribosyltransferase regulatory subunit
MSESYESLRALLSDAGYDFVEPPIVQDAGVFVELAGEDLRRRLFLTSAADGRELALRPDYTIPVCLGHLATGPAKRRANYAYLGPVFRQRRDEPGEFLQAGVESLGRTDRQAADADILKLALDATRLLGVKKPSVRIGDSGLFAAMLDALEIGSAWRTRLARTFGDAPRLRALIDRANGKAEPAPLPDRKAARAKAEQLLAASGLGVIGGRTADEIADRVVEKAAIAAGIGERPARILEKYLAIKGDPKAALSAVKALARQSRLDIGAAVEQFAARNEAFTGHGIDLKQLSFAADFGRRLDYYTGFVFEMHKAIGAKQIVGGGRYDRLLGMMAERGKGRSPAIPAVGFAIWLDRIGARR